MTILSNKKLQPQQPTTAQTSVSSSNNSNVTNNDANVINNQNSIISQQNPVPCSLTSSDADKNLNTNIIKSGTNDSIEGSVSSSVLAVTENVNSVNKSDVKTTGLENIKKTKNDNKKNASSTDDSKTVNIQINDMQTVNEVLNMPLSSSSSSLSSSPSSLTNFQAETGSNSSNKNKNKKNVIKSNKKRKLSTTSSVHIDTNNMTSINNLKLSTSTKKTNIILKSPKFVSTLSSISGSDQMSCSSLKNMQKISEDLNLMDVDENKNKNIDLTNKKREDKSSSSISVIDFEKQASTNNMLKLNTKNIKSNDLCSLSEQQQIVKNNSSDHNIDINSDNENNDSDSDFDFLNKTDNQGSEDEEDSDINTQNTLKQNRLNQQIQQQQHQIYMQQQKELNENLNILTNSTHQMPKNSRKKLTKKKSSTANNKSKLNKIGIKENNNNFKLSKGQKENNNNYETNINSEDEYENRPIQTRNLNLSGLVNKNTNNSFKSEKDMQNVLFNAETIEELEAKFCQLMKEKKGFIIKPMKEDGACLFRAVADQIYGDQEMHSTIRSHCMDYIAKNADYFKQYMTEDVDRYLNRKRQDTCHGNHIEIIATAEIYNRPIEVYEYSIEPKNTFQSVFDTDNEPIRLSYHGRNHYNSVINPYKATIGVGLGLPQLTPGLAEKNLMNEALKKSEEVHLEKTMLDDKVKATDWEATNEEIMELIARESYLQWLKDNEKRNTPRHSLNLSSSSTSTSSSSKQGQSNQANQGNVNGNATCSTWDNQTTPSVSSITNNENNSLTSNSDIRLSPSRNQKHNSHKVNRRVFTATPPHSPSQQGSKLTHLKTSPKNSKNEPHSSKKHEKSSGSSNMLNLTNMTRDSNIQNQLVYGENVSMQNAQSEYQYYEPMNEILQPEIFGLGNNDWLGLDNQNEGVNNDGDSDILARVLAASQQEYLENLKARHNQQT